MRGGPIGPLDPLSPHMIYPPGLRYECPYIFMSFPCYTITLYALVSIGYRNDQPYRYGLVTSTPS